MKAICSALVLASVAGSAAAQCRCNTQQSWEMAFRAHTRATLLVNECTSVPPAKVACWAAASGFGGHCFMTTPTVVNDLTFDNALALNACESATAVAGASYAEAWAVCWAGSTPLGALIALDLYSDSGVFDACYRNETDALVVSSSGASGSIKLELTPTLDAQWNIEFGPGTVDLPASAAMHLSRLAFRYGSPIGLLLGPNGGVKQIGGATQQLDGTWTATVPVTGSGVTVVGGSIINFTDAELDPSGDGRFNQLDPAALVPFYGTSVSLHPKFDLDSDGDIDADDRTVMQALVDAGFGSGIFGDFDQDGLITCLDGVGVSFSASLGDPDYSVELDFDLDGDNDSSDEAAFYVILPSSDFNNDGDYGTDGDIDAFFACLGGTGCCPTCKTVDLNGDGDFGTDADIETWFHLMAGNCP